MFLGFRHLEKMVNIKTFRKYILKRKMLLKKEAFFHMKIQLITEVTEELPVVPG